MSQPVNLDKAVLAAQRFMDSLGDKRRGSFELRYCRTEDFRKAAMEKNGTPLVSYAAHASIRIYPGEIARIDPARAGEDKLLFYGVSIHFEPDPAQAIIKACRGIKTALQTLGELPCA